MQITSIETGYAIKFPFELKDNFRKAFPSAKWNSTLKQWEVGSRSGTRLQQWVSEVGHLEDEIKEIDAIELTAEEITKVKCEIETLLKTARQRKGEYNDLAEAIQILESLKPKLAEAMSKAQKSKEDAQKAKDEIKARLNKIIDIDEARNLASTMAKSIKSLNHYQCAKFAEAQSKIREMFWKLQDANLECAAITFCHRANKNRPDRDSPSNLQEKAWYTLTELEDD